MNNPLLAAALVAAAIATPATAGEKFDPAAFGTFLETLNTPPVGPDEWLQDLVLQPPTLSIDDPKSVVPQVKAPIVVVNNGKADSKAIEVDCVLFDQWENTIGHGSTVIYRIKPGRKGYGEVSDYVGNNGDARIIECAIAPYQPVDDLIRLHSALK